MVVNGSFEVFHFSKGMAEHRVVSASYWMSFSALQILLVFISLLILRHEWKKRKEIDVKFTTKSLRLTSITCIIFGLVSNISFFFLWFDGLCIFTGWLANVSMYIQFLSMGFYQLSRLYYSFANDQIHSDKGYPKWIFITMIMFGIVIFIIYSISLMFDDPTGLNAECGINSKYEYQYFPINNNHQRLTLFGQFLSLLAYVVWDLITLSLYMVKIKVFNKYEKSEPIVYKRILSILYKIAIITLYYDISLLIGTVLTFIVHGFELIWFEWIAGVIGSGGTILYSVSIMLMMDYNSGLYGSFLITFPKSWRISMLFQVLKLD